MKNTLLLLTFTLTFILSFSTADAQNTYVPDDNFEQALIDLGYDSGALNDSVSIDSISQVTTLNLAGKAISSIEGIEAFINLQDLNISNNQLTSVDLSFNDKLTGLICFNNRLTKLNLSANIQLTNLNCSNNQIETLDLSLISSLQYLNCSNNNLSRLNIRNGNNPLMTGGDYRITGIDTRNNPALYCIDVDDPDEASKYATWFKDKWTSLETNCSGYKVEMTYVPDDNFEQFLINSGYDTGELNDSVPTVSLKKIEYLNISYSGIKKIKGIESFESLSRLYCSGNEITNLDLSSNKLLTQLDCSNNKISSLDISQNELLTSVFCNYNQIIDIDASYNTFLTNINCSYNLLTGLNVRNGNNTNLQLNAGNNTNLFCIQVDDVALANSKAYWYKNAYTAYSEDCANFTPEMTYVPDDNFEQALIYLGLDTNNLNDSVPTISLKSLKSLNVSHKNISDLTGIKDFDALEELYCYSNQIAEIDLSSNSNLKKLQIQNNNLIDLDLSANSLLTSINVSYNQLTGLNLKNGNNSNMSTEARYNSNLLCIQVDDSEATYGYSNWYKNAYTAYTEDCSSYTPEMTYVPDDNFEQALINLRLDFDENINDSVPTIALYSLNSLNLNSKSIHDFTGIQSCVNLKYFNCRSNYMDSLDLTKNRELMDLDCSYNSLKELDISENNNLTKLICNDNSLTNIVFSKHDFLEFINCSNNEIEEISEIESNSLTTFYCESNKLTKLDLFKLPSLVQLVCRDNNLNELDVSSNAQLTTLIAERNLLTFVNLQNGNNENLDLDLYQNMPACIQVDDTVFAQSKPKNEWSIDDWSYYSENCSGHSVDMVYIPDDNFEKALLEQRYDDGKLNDSIPIAIAEHIISLNIDNSNISDLTGIEYFVNLGALRCCNNNLDKLDLSKNTNLSGLYCYNNNITSLKIDSCIELIRLYCGNNQITEIDVSRFNKLYRFSCYSNKIVNLDLSNNPDILYLGAYSNLLSSLNIKNRNNPDFQFNVQNNPNLFCIEVDDAYSAIQNAKWYKDETAYYSEDCSNKSAMTYIPDDNFEQALIDLGYDSGELDDSVLTAKIFSVTSLNIPNKGIKSLEGIQGFEQLIGLNCYNNSIEELDLSKNKKLKYLRCQNNNLHFLNYKNGNNSNNTFNATYNPFLFCIEVDDNEASSNYSNWEKDIWADYSEDCSGYFDKKTYIPDDNFEQALIDLGYDSGELDDSVSTSVIEKIAQLSIRNKNIANLQGIEDFTSLEELYCSTNNIGELNLTNNPKLVYLECSHNRLTSINVDSNKNLKQIICDENRLSELYLTQNLALEYLDCSHNNIVSLDLEENNKLLSLYCYYNNLSELNIKNGNNLNMSTNDDPSMVAYENPNLRCIQVDDAIAANNFEGWLKDEKAVYSENCNALLTQMTYIPDDNFEQALIDLGYDSGKLNDLVPLANILFISSLDISGKGIYSMQGIQDFSLLSFLDCHNNNISNIELDSNQNLESLRCFNNKIEILDLSANKKMTYLECQNNELTRLNIKNGNNINLTTLYSLNNPSLFCIEVDNIALTDAKQYWYKDAWTTYSENCGNILGAGVPHSEYKALEDLYYSTNGNSWTNNTNWLDTINASVEDWYGVTVENGHVTKIVLNENNLQNEAFKEKARLPELRVIELGDNELTGFNFYAIDSLYSLDTIMLNNNRLIFDDISPAFSNSNFSNFSNHFYYQEQQEVDYFQDLIAVIGNPFELALSDSFISVNDRFQWYKDGQRLEGKTNSTLSFESIAFADSGAYHVEITNANVPVLVLKSQFKIVNPYYGVAAGKGVPDEEYQALVDFYNSTNGSKWTNNTNWLDTVNHTVADWFGITVANNHVTGIYFGPYEVYNINGNIPNSIKDLTQLESLEIITDKLNGELPAGLFELTNLRKLYLSECNISGPLPMEIGNLTKLEVLGLEANNLQGNIPTGIGNLTKLKSLSLQENNFTGAIPFELGTLANLEYLGLSDNQLSGEIPSSFGGLINLKWLLLDHNQLSGTIPTELDRLTKLVKFAIDHNLFGQTINTKSAVSNSVENHRVIPDFVSNFIDLDTFSIANNQIQFNDIEAIFNWDNFNDINKFEYAPQAKIGIEKTIESEEETIISLSIENYYPAPSDQYQWFKNNEKLNGVINDKLEFASLATEDAGIYYCQVSNTKVPNLILTSNEMQLVVTEKIPVDTVPDQEYDALVNLVNAFPDINFGENWLDTTSSKVKDWQGITVRNGHVVALDLSNLKLNGDVFDIFTAFDSLQWVNLSGNNLYGPFPTFSGEKSGSNVRSVKENAYNLRYLNIANNRFMFSDLEPVADELLAIDTFIYSPQQIIGYETDTSIYKNQDLTIKIAEYISGEHDIQKWYKNDQYTSVNKSDYIITNASLQDSGVYHLQVTNSLFSDLTLNSAPYKLKVMVPVGINDMELSGFEIYPNPAEKRLFIDTKNNEVNIELYNSAGTKVLTRKQFRGGWLNIEKYPKGLYFIKLETKESVFSQKVLFK